MSTMIYRKRIYLCKKQKQVDMNKLIVLLFMFMETSCLSAQNDKVKLAVGNYAFTVTLEQNATASAFMSRFPLTMNMSELNGNEKYYTLSQSLPTAAHNSGTIYAGDIMLYGSSTIVIFYKTFQTSYSYTKIGHVDDVTNLQQALGMGSVQVNFSKEEATGIRGAKVASDDENNSYYTLLGQKVRNPQKGIYVRDGRKILK